MYEQLVEAIRTEGSRLAAAQRTSIEMLGKLRAENGDTANFSLPISENDRSVSDLDTLTSSLIKFTEGFREDKNWSFVPRNWISEFSDALKSTANSYENLSNNLAAIDAQHGGLASLDPKSFSVKTKSGTDIDVRKLLSNVSVNVDNGFANYFKIRPAITAPRLSEFADLFALIANRRTELDGLSHELSRLAKESKEDANIAKNSAGTATESQKEIDRLKADAAKDGNEIQAAVVDATKNVAAVEEIKKKADELSANVASYQKTFDQFQKDLDSRNADYVNKSDAFEKLIAELDDEEGRIASISKQADDMLKGATNAGLAGSYSNKQIAIEYEISKARIAYYVSILLLVFLTLPIFLYSFPREYLAELFKHLFAFEMPAILARDTNQSEIHQALNFIGRAVFLIPGLMFVRFASTRHAQLFRLREDYAYKYSIAASVDGFMKQAKEYSDDIAAACYYELTYNPAEHMDSKNEDARMLNPIFEKMLSRLEARMVKVREKKAANN